MLNKKAIAASVLVVMIVMVVIFIVLFRIDTLIAGMISGGAEDQICFWSASLSSLTKVGPKTLMDLHCPRRVVYVMLEPNDVPVELREKNVEYDYIDKPIPQKLRVLLADWYEEPETNFDIKQNKDRVLRYRLNEIMAKELKRCWGNLGKGTYDLFDQDLSPIGHTPGTFKEGDSLPTTLLKSTQLWKIEFKKIPKVCKICSTIIFHDTVKSKFKDEIDLKPFLLKNPVASTTKEALSYYEFLEDDIKQTDFFRPEYEYTTDKIQAIVFLRMNLHTYVGEMFKDWSSLKIAEIVSDRDYKEGEILAVDMPLIIPFNEVNSNCDRYA